MSVSLLIAIAPPKKIVEKIAELRSYIAKKTGKNIYGYHEPHITLFVNTFRDFSNVERHVIKIVEKYNPFHVKIEGIHTFTNDPIFKAHNIVYKVQENSILAKLQKDIVERLNPLRTDDQAKWLIERNPNLSKQNIKNIQKYGYPYSPKEWIFHISIGSVSKDKYGKMWGKAQQYNLTKAWLVNTVGVYINLGEDGFTLFRKYKLEK